MTTKIILAIALFVVLSSRVLAEEFIFTGNDTVLLCSGAVLYLPYQANHDTVTFVINNESYNAVMADNPSEYSYSFNEPFLEGTVAFTAIALDGEYFSIRDYDTVTCSTTPTKIYLPIVIGK